MSSSFSWLSTTELTSRLWKCTSLLLSFRNFWSYLIHRNQEKDNIWKIFSTDSMLSWSLEEKWSEKLSTIASIVSSMKHSSSTELLNFLIYWPASFLVLLFLSENNTSFSSKMSSFLSIRFKLAISSTNTWWDAPCSSWPKTHLLVFSCLMDLSSTGLLPTHPKKLCSSANSSKSSKLVKFRSWSLTFPRFSRDWLSVSQGFICKLLTERCASSKMTTS